MLNALIIKMKEVILGPHEIIYSLGSKDNRLYFIKQG